MQKVISILIVIMLVFSSCSRRNELITPKDNSFKLPQGTKLPGDMMEEKKISDTAWTAENFYKGATAVLTVALVYFGWKDYQKGKQIQELQCNMNFMTNNIVNNIVYLNKEVRSIEATIKNLDLSRNLNVLIEDHNSLYNETLPEIQKQFRVVHDEFATVNKTFTAQKTTISNQTQTINNLAGRIGNAEAEINTAFTQIKAVRTTAGEALTHVGTARSIANEASLKANNASSSITTQSK